MATRSECDTFGAIEVPVEHLWGVQTQRSLEHFRISTEKVPHELILALVLCKKVAASVNAQLKRLDEPRASAIISACEEILNGGFDDEFPLSLWQTGSGSQTNMNVNEVIATLASRKAGLKVHPNDHCNMGQSTNDIFPAAINVCASMGLAKAVAALDELIRVFRGKAEEYGDVLKVGRTHLQDATPVTLGQEIGGWAAQLEISTGVLRSNGSLLLALAAGGTAVGTGLNCHPDFAVAFAREMARVTGLAFITAADKFAALAGCEAVIASHSAIKGVAAALFKIANDVRWLASGPRCGLGELSIPANEAGSSIMPGKVNPTQCEALTMCVARIFGNDVTVSLSGASGNFELNVYQPVIADALLQSIRLLTGGVESFTKWCAVGIEPCRERLAKTVGDSLMLVTALCPVIGYDRAAKIATHADRRGLTLKESAVELGELTEEEFDRYVIPGEMVAPK